MDFLNVMTFDFHETSETTTAHHSPLGPLSTNSGDTLTTASTILDNVDDILILHGA